MACCAAGVSCPTHAPVSGHDHGGVSQADADRCCAASEGREPAPSGELFVPVVALELAVSPVSGPATAATPVMRVWRSPEPSPGRRVPTHLLLSVFLL